MTISTRQELVDHCLRELGEPVIQINVAPEQIEDRVDFALQVYQEYHSDATRRNYYEYQVTASDVTNGYITLPDNILWVVKMFPVDSSFINSSNMFSFKYQFALSDFHNLASLAGGMDYFVQTKQYLELLDMTLNGQPQVSFVRHMNRFYLWGEFEGQDVKADDWLALEVYETIDPTQYPAVYNDMFVKEFTTAQIKKQWGQNLSKFDGVQLPGGVTIDGRQMRDEANEEIRELRERMRSEHEKPVDFFCG